ncbi:uncharacterized protein DNG_06826 [Cephalotrichum gorgonifer]|uniref:BZIP domain-containing protein n=1 Tax=Cephalotrichum gorgonifer TaxID=2041049 RepID=A0AAE8N2C4_9PEZI|nr:uncharacterized protein DNG_06826 [Cephalotrichum gorgonifer]
MEQTIIVQPMPHHCEMRGAEEDWSGVTSSQQRRKMQNRLNQRACRRRRQMEACGAPLLERSSRRSNSADASARADERVTKKAQQEPHAPARRVCSSYSPEKHLLLQQFATQAYSAYIAGAPCPTHLPRLIQVNILGALTRNAQALNLSNSWLLCDAISVLDEDSLSSISCPKSLRPTALQVSVSHHPWIDLLPLPRLRENILKLIDIEGFDEDELCHDMVEFDSEEGPEKAALIIWGDPWDPRGWEASVAFLRKWGWLLTGCPEILEATNYWREKRGERRLSWGA